MTTDPSTNDWRRASVVKMSVFGWWT